MKKAWKLSLDVKQLDPEYSRKDKIKKNQTVLPRSSKHSIMRLYSNSEVVLFLTLT